METFFDLFQFNAANDIAVFTKLFCISLSFQLAWNFSSQLKFYDAKPWVVYGKPHKLIGFFELPLLNKTSFIIAGLLLIVSLIFISLNIAPKWFLLVSIITFTLYFYPIRSFQYVMRKTNLVFLVLIVLFISPSSTLAINDRATGWEIVLIKLCLAQIYFSSAIQKLRKSGFSWFNGKTLQVYFMRSYLLYDKKIAVKIAINPVMCIFFSVFSISFELTFWMITIFPALTWYYVIAGLLFHLINIATMRINYLVYLTPVYTIFFTRFFI